MNKSYLIIILCLLSFSSYSQLAEEGFEGTWTTGQGPDGWKILQNNIGTSTMWAQSAAGSETLPPYEGLHAAYINRQNVNGVAEDYLVTPVFNAPDNGELHFYSRLTQGEDQGSIYKIFIINVDAPGMDANDPEDYTEIQSWTETLINPVQTDYYEKIVYIPSDWNGLNVRIAFMMAGDEQDRWLIDDVKVIAPCLAPANLTADNITTTSADLYWENSGGNDTWEIELDIQDNTTTGSGFSYTGTIPYSASGLIPGTTYKYFIRTLCNDTDMSGWAGPYIFSTINPGDTCDIPLVIASLPFSDANNTANFADTYQNSSGSNCASDSFFGYLNGNDVVYEYIADTTGMISIDLSGIISYSAVFIYDDCDNIGVNCLAGAVTDYDASPIAFEFPVTAEENYFIVISNGFQYQTTGYNLIVQQVSCDKPVGLPVTNIGMDTASLSWTNPTGATSWEIQVQYEGSGIPIGAGEYTSTINTDFAIPSADLTSLTAYEYFVRSDCGDNTFSAWAGPYFFKTMSCAVEDQCTYTFDMWNLYDAGSWNNNTMSVMQNGITLAVLTGPDFNQGHAYTDVPVCSGFPLQLYWNGGGAFAEEIAVQIKSSFDQIIFTKNPGEGEPNTLLLNYDLSNCHIPLCLPPQGLSALNPTLDGFDITWAWPVAGDMEYYVTEAGDSAPTDTTIENVEPTTTNFVTIEGLLPATNYEYYVRLLCTDSDTDHSAWAGPYPFSTKICPEEEQCDFMFRLSSPNGFGWNTAKMTVSQNGTNVAVIGPSFDTGFSQDILVGLCHDMPFQVFWDNGGYFSNDIGLEILNSFGQTLYYLPFGSSATLGTVLYEGSIDCVTPLCLPPTVLTASNPTQTTIDIQWDDATAGTWEYYFVPEGEAAPGAATIGTSTTVSNVIGAGPLEPGTNYNYYVRQICDTGLISEWSEPFAFSTSVCAEEDKCNYTFVMKNGFAPNWLGGYMTITQGGTFVSQIGPTPGSLNTQAITVALCPGEPFEIFWNNGGNNPTQKTISVINPFGQVIYSMPQLSNGSIGTTVYEGFVDCDNPACLPPVGLNAQNGTVTSIDLSWNSPAEAWEYYIVEADGEAPDADTSGIGTTTSTVVGIPLANPGTNYKYYVRMACNVAGGFSEWAGPYYFHSEACNADEKCSYVFEMTSQYGLGYQGNTVTIFQGGLAMATIGSQFTSGTSMSVNVPLCPDIAFEVFWNIGGNNPALAGLKIFTPFGEDLFVKNFGSSVLGTTIYSNIVSCVPPLCLKPQNPQVTPGIGLATFSWNEMGDASAWEIWVIPVGSDEPTTAGQIVTQNPYIYGTMPGEYLNPGVDYTFFVRAYCGTENGYSNRAQSAAFITAVENDNCNSAIPVPVNMGVVCNDYVSGTIYGATSSGFMPSCQWSMPQNDVWYSFVAQSEEHAISILNADTYMYQAIYEGNCDGGLTEIFCGTFSDASIKLAGLTIGNTYYVQVYSLNYIAPSTIITFDICIRVPQPPIAVNDTEYTVEELVKDVLIGSDCILVSNITSSTGSDYGKPNGIGYFNRNGSNFPFEEGIILATGTINEAPAGSNLGFLTEGTDWPGDDDLFEIISAMDNLLPGQGLVNASILEFDFVPLSDHMSFDFIFASNEYGPNQCTYSDAFAFILTGAGAEPQNLAVIPNTSIPVSVINIRDLQYSNGACASANEEYFGQYNPADPIAASIHYFGQTIPMQAEADVIPGETYHIKMVISDFGATLWGDVASGLNSAVFLSADSFKMGDIDLGPNMLVANSTALCDYEQVTLHSGLDPDLFTFTWSFNDDVIDGETGPDLLVAQAVDEESASGKYSIEASYTDITCIRKGEVIVEFYDPVLPQVGAPVNQVECTTTGFAQFELTENTAAMLAGTENPERYDITYHTTDADAITAANALEMLYTNSMINEQTIYIRVYNNVTECFGITSFKLMAQDVPVFTIGDDFSICEGTSGTITIVPDNFSLDDAVYSWTKNNEAVAGITNALTVTDDGQYEVTVNINGCTATQSVNVSVTSVVADTSSDIVSCGSYILPVLNIGNAYYTGQGATGTVLPAGHLVETTQQIYIYAHSNTVPDCIAETSFMVTIVPVPVADAPSDVTACTVYALPALSAGNNYYTGPGGTGMVLNAGTLINNTQYVYVYAQNLAAQNCNDENIFTITINPAIVPVTAFTLPATICTGISSVMPLPGEGFTAGGTYSAVEGLAINPSTGEIDPQASMAGTYTVTYTIASDSDSCNPGSSGEAVTTIEPLANAITAFSFISPACSSSANQLPATMTGFTTGGTFTATTGLAIDVNTGEINMDASLPGTYVVTYTTVLNEFTCTAQGSSTTIITIKTATVPVTGFNYEDSYCLGTAIALPQLSEGFTGGGVFTSVAGLDIDPITGTVNIAGNAVGSYTVTYTVPEDLLTCNTGGTYTDSFTISDGIVFVLEGSCIDNDYFITAKPETGSFEESSFEWVDANGVVVGYDSKSFNVTDYVNNTPENETFPLDFMLTVINNGCESSEIYSINGIYCGIQKGISPNGDNLNDEFDLAHLNVKRLEIFNRYGQEVYALSNYTDEWHGQASNGDILPTGTYYYVIEFASGEAKTGWIYINREVR
jgi:gliding motility-associated-like protein